MTRLVGCLGCGVLVYPGPRCYNCRTSQARLYDATRPAHHALYSTAAWRKLSAEVRAGATRCHWCLKPTRSLRVGPPVEVPEREYFAARGEHVHEGRFRVAFPATVRLP